MGFKNICHLDTVGDTNKMFCADVDFCCKAGLQAAQTLELRAWSKQSTPLPPPKDSLVLLPPSAS